MIAGMQGEVANNGEDVDGNDEARNFSGLLCDVAYFMLSFTSLTQSNKTMSPKNNL